MLDLQTLVLNADYRPLSYNPLSLWSWKNAFTALFLDRVTLVASYDVEARSPSRALRVPSVVALKNYVTLARSPAFTRYNIYLRDTFSCQYCGLRLPSGGLTFDHVVPRAQGGRTTWENVVTACSPCNLKKGGRTPKQAAMPLHIEAIRPTNWHLQEHGRSFPPNYLHDTWHDWLYWDVELEA